MCIYIYIRIATIGSESEAKVNPLSSLVLKARESKQVHVRHCPKRQIVQHQGPDLRTITATLLDYSDYTIFTRQRNWPDLMCRWCAMKSCALKLALQTQLKTSFCKMRWSSVPPCTRGAIQSTLQNSHGFMQPGLRWIIFSPEFWCPLHQGNAQVDLTT